MIRAATLALAVALSPPVQAQNLDFCAALAQLSHAATQPDGPAPVISFPGGQGREVPCTSALELGGVRSLSCRWAHPYRSEGAAQAFAQLLTEITACVGPAIGGDTPVNHPDSYDLRRFPDGISAALKDKAALRESIVILRVQGQ